MDTIALITERVQCQPVRELRGTDDPRFSAAEWRLPAHRLVTGCQSDHMLIYRTDGPVTASKSVGRSTVRKRGVTEVVSLIPAHEEARYGLEDDGCYLEVYVAPELLRDFCEQNPGSGAASVLPPFFAEQDAWLSGYFRMLGAELALHPEPVPELDRLLLGQARQLLLSYLVHQRRDGAQSEQTLERAPSPLRPHLVRRVEEFIEARFSSSIRLEDLATLVHLSERHFMRAFRAATGCTPYQYLLQWRLRASAELLTRTPELSVANVARLCGFGSQACFAARFRERYGVTPTRFRSRRIGS